MEDVARRREPPKDFRHFLRGFVAIVRVLGETDFQSEREICFDVEKSRRVGDTRVVLSSERRWTRGCECRTSP